ncbi:MAG: hypothetical protein V1715_04425 [bacterium]
MPELMDYHITYKSFPGAWMTLTGIYPARNMKDAIKIFKQKSPYSEIESITRFDKNNRLHGIKMNYPRRKPKRG